MNFLGHLFFSNNDPQLMHANLLGDSVKGKDYSHLPQKIQDGVKLHRTIDNYIDTHPVVLELLRELYKPLPKISGVAVDLYFDHLLARNWSSFHEKSLKEFVKDFYAIEFKTPEQYSYRFDFMIGKMKEFDWLYEYRNHSGLTQACLGLSRRISFENVLAKAPEIFLECEESIELAFNRFMSDAIPFFESYFKEN
ncbi:MAG: ACP phosphodiesterase [Crocinitomicaceae bacterium]